MSSSVLLKGPETVPVANDADGRSDVGSTSTNSSRAEFGNWWQGLEWFVAGTLALAAIALHLRFATNVGALWRDETNSVNLATLPTLQELWHFLDYDSFPALYFCVLRVWTSLFGTENDVALRGLGLIIGLGILAALWTNARAFSGRLPLLSFALVGLNVMVIRYGDSTRAYGLGIFLILLTLGSFWRLVEDPSRPTIIRIVGTAALSILSVQCLYYNSVLLLAIAFGACAVALQAKAWRTCLIVLGIGALAALSLLPYLPIIVRMRAWTFMVSYPSTFSWLWLRVGEVIGSPRHEGIWIWITLLSGATAIGSKSTFAHRARRRPPEKPQSAMLFALVTLITGIIGYTLFLRVLNYYTQPWYYITLAVFTACLLDSIYGLSVNMDSRQGTGSLLRIFRPVFVTVFLFFNLSQAWKQIPIRHTNADQVAHRIGDLSEQGDLILVPRWERAISFSRYYQGPAKIVTIPPLTDHRFHRYDLVLEQMRRADSVDSVLSRIEDTLRAGHKVFLTDLLPFPEADPKLSTLRPPFQDAGGNWHSSPYYDVWHRRAGRFIRVHATSARSLEVPDPAGAAVQDFETLVPAIVTGWH